MGRISSWESIIKDSKLRNSGEGSSRKANENVQRFNYSMCLLTKIKENVIKQIQFIAEKSGWFLTNKNDIKNVVITIECLN